MSSGFESVRERLGGLLGQRDAMAAKVITTGISYLDDCALGLHPTDLMVLSAATGAGKTTAGLFMASQAAKNGLRSHFLALEAFRGEIEARLLFRELGALVSRDGNWTPDLTFNRWMHNMCSEFSNYETKAKANLEERFESMKTLYRSSNFTHENVTRQLLAVKGHTDLVVLDHLHFIDLESHNENAELKKTIKVIRDVGLSMGVSVVVIAHLRKKHGPRSARTLPEIDDIHGSSDISKAATKIVMLSPCAAIPFGESGENKRIATTAIQVLKDRYAGATNYVGLVGFDLARMSYRDTYALARLTPSGTALAHLHQNELPRWAAERGQGLRCSMGEESSLA